MQRETDGMEQARFYRCECGWIGPLLRCNEECPECGRCKHEFVAKVFYKPELHVDVREHQ